MYIVINCYLNPINSLIALVALFGTRYKYMLGQTNYILGCSYDLVYLPRLLSLGCADLNFSDSTVLIQKLYCL